jgi:hypothetical protein
MADPSKGFIPQPIRMAPAVARPACQTGPDETVVCERCGADMFRMHAVWRCPKCRFKTDCCGW